MGGIKLLKTLYENVCRVVFKWLIILLSEPIELPGLR